jgi:glycosyltransferase involved in cell wall biosynthesis
MKVIFSAFELPPLASPGVRRPLGFIKHLPDFGITPLVVTTDAESYAEMMDAPSDSSLLKAFPEHLRIERVPCRKNGAQSNSKLKEWFRIYFALVEQQAKYWEPHLTPVFDRLVAEQNPAAIYATMPPFCMGPLWCKLAKRAGLPLVLDLRDAWSQWRVGPYGSWLHYYLTLKLERSCLEAADCVVTTSNQIRDDFLKLHKNVSPEKVVVITNGYDNEVSDFSLEGQQTTKTTFDIGYVGSFYYNPSAREAMMMPWWKKRPNRMIQYAPRKEDWLYRSPYFFFKALKQLFAENSELRKVVRVRFAGRKPEWIDAQVTEFGLQDVVTFVGHLSHSDVLQFQKNCDALLLTSSKVIGGNDYSIAGKTFEYFSMRKPIIGFVTNGAQKEILAKSGVAVICDPDDPTKSADQLKSLIMGGVTLNPDFHFLKGLHRRELTSQLAEVFKRVGK